MEIKEINYYGDDGWTKSDTYNTIDKYINIPRIGDTIKSKISNNTYKVSNVTWILEYKMVNIDCKLIKEN